MSFLSLNIKYLKEKEKLSEESFGYLLIVAVGLFGIRKMAKLILQIANLLGLRLIQPCENSNGNGKECSSKI